MKLIQHITLACICALMATAASAQVVKRNGDNDRNKKDEKGVVVSDRQQSFYEVREPHDADLQWMKVVYRSLDLSKGKNAALYYPEEPNEDGQNMFYIIMRLLANGQIEAYEYLDGREMFTDQYKISVQEMLDRFHVLYTEAKGSSEKHRIYTIEDADIPGNEILSYYIIEKWEFDTRANAMKARVEALCPVMHRQDDYGGEPIRYPMFWVKLNDIRPYLANQFVFTDDDNNLPRYNLDDFFKLNMYEGDIYKVKNLQNKSLMELYPEEEALKHAQDSIEQRLRSFDKNLWVPSREEMLAQAEAKKRAEAELNGEELDEDGNADDKNDKKADKSARAKSKRAEAQEDDNKNNKNKKNKKNKTKAKKQSGSSSSSSNNASRSVRNRKR